MITAEGLNRPAHLFKRLMIEREVQCANVAKNKRV